MISANNITLRIGKKALFEDVNIKFTEGNCYGLIGANGAGKSTFLKILSGQLEPTSGDIAITPGQRLSFLQQDHFKYDEFTVLDTVIMGNKRLYDIMKEKEAIYMKEDFSDEDGIRASELEAEFADMDGWNAESDAATMLNGLGIPTEDHYTLMADMPSALKVKVLLAQALFGNPDILLLDEPTNHLDLASREWIEEAVEAFDGTLLFVSHDRYFVERFATRVLYLENGRLIDFIGSYSAFLDWRGKCGCALPAAEAAPVPKKKKAAVPTLDDVPKPPEKPKRTGGTKNLQKQLSTLEREISQLETQSGELEQQMVDAASDSSRLLELMTEKETCDEKLAAKMDEWEAVAAELEAMQ